MTPVITKARIAALASGALFGVGLVVSGMTKPSKVAGFLDVTGAWDASLAFVMGGAVLVHVVLLRLVVRRGKPLFADALRLPTRRDIDPRLVVGGGLFGIGWGLGGLCPGPGLVAAAAGVPAALAFVATMIVGILVHDAVTARHGVESTRKNPSP